ncbi:Catalase [Methylomagnum ishizawai]|uniref:Catalase n=1 Tax=Methylomagnum ishizawai TaxID=1760988 RepID=A0A1Y6D259_9GAMM|nr:catalase family protein [Methylomagnum ishizawai]SMF96717.1 Catalase [Methylomagnum ishizawai]
MDFPTLPPHPFETVPAGEAAQIAEIADLTRKLLQQRYPGSMARRGVHPKDHGCVEATLTVNADIPSAYRQGIFATPGKSYKTWVRFSNATALVQADVDAKGAASSRGIALKVMNVEGETLLDAPGGKTQDFLMINLPMFAFADVAEYLELTRSQFANNDNLGPFFTPPFSDAKKRTLGIVGKIAATPMGNPVESQYFSASPFLLGENLAVKYSVKPRNPGNTPVPANPGPSYLREALKKTLDPKTGQAVVFDFLVQRRATNALPIEDATAVWPEDIAPFEAVATLVIQPQDFDNPLRATECEHLVFTPWHSLREHRPLGGINRLRLAAYIASSKYRLQSREPTAFPKDPYAPPTAG